MNLNLCGRLLRWLVVPVQRRAWWKPAGMPRGCHRDASGMPWLHLLPPAQPDKAPVATCQQRAEPQPVGIEAMATQPWPVGTEAMVAQPCCWGFCRLLVSATALEHEMIFSMASLAVSTTAFLLAWFFFPSVMEYFTYCFFWMFRPFLWHFIDTESVSLPEMTGGGWQGLGQAVSQRGVSPRHCKQRCNKPAAG